MLTERLVAGFTPAEAAEIRELAARDDRSVAYVIRLAVLELLARRREEVQK